LSNCRGGQQIRDRQIAEEGNPEFEKGLD
jgi:hypothetical protein